MVDQLTRIVRDRELRLLITKNNREHPSPVDWSDVVARNVAAYRLAIEMRTGTRRRPRLTRASRRPARVMSRAPP